MIPPPTPHAPLGAGASFHFGPPGAPAGFALPSAAAPADPVLVGCRPSAREPWSLLPFFTPVAGGPPPLPKGRFGRFLAWAGDKWMIGPLVFKLCTPFSTDDPPADERFSYAPVVCGYLEYDNTHSPDTAELLFALGGEFRPGATSDLLACLRDETHGFATAPSAEVTMLRDDALFGVPMGPASGFRFRVPPHAKRIYPLVLGLFPPGLYAASLFAGLSAALAYGLREHARYLALADAADAAFMRSTLAFDQKTIVAHETRTWLASTRRRQAESPPDLAPLRALAQRVANGR